MAEVRLVFAEPAFVALATEALQQAVMTSPPLKAHEGVDLFRRTPPTCSSRGFDSPLSTKKARRRRASLGCDC